MEITCLQMDVLISFYLENELSPALREKVEEHLQKCPVCKAKCNIMNSLFTDLKKVLPEDNDAYSTNTHSSRQYVLFKNNLSAYVDNELSQEENIKMKKFTINNKNARRELENAINIRKLMKDSFKKSKMDSKPDFSKKILKHLDSEINNSLSFNPLIKVAFAFIVSVILISAIVIYLLSM
jgi:anti-sigma factor RsiW